MEHSWLKRRIDNIERPGLMFLTRQMRQGDELWEYSSPDESWEALHGEAGHALVRDGKIVAKLVEFCN